MPQLYPGRRYYRAKAPLQVLRGFSPTEPGNLSVTAPPLAGAGIQQGMAIVLDANGNWIKAAIGSHDALSQSIYIALQDQDAPSVQASGLLTGLDCSGGYEIQTAYYTGTFTLDAEVGLSATAGYFGLAVATKKVVGKISAVGASVDGSGAATNGAFFYKGQVLPTLLAADSYRIQFKTVPSYIKP